METIVTFIVFGLPFISVPILLFIGWQYVTGRSYWGEEKDSMVLPSLFCLSIPLFNLGFVLLVSISFIILNFIEMLKNMRNNSIKKRESNDNKNYSN